MFLNHVFEHLEALKLAFWKIFFINVPPNIRPNLGLLGPSRDNKPYRKGLFSPDKQSMHYSQMHALFFKGVVVGEIKNNVAFAKR